MYSKYIQLSGQLAKKFNSSNQVLFLGKNYENYISKRCAGHSKWQNIKSTKEASDRLRSETFSRISRLLIYAVKENGDNPSINYKLKQLLEEAQKANMPKATIERAMKQAKTQTASKPYWIVFTGPNDLILGFEVVFAKKNHGFLMSKLKPQIKKFNLAMQLHFNHLCKECGVIVTEPLTNNEKSYDKAVEDAIEIGIDEVTENDDRSLTFECLPDRVDSLSKKLKDKGYNIISASAELDFHTFVNINENDLKEIEDLINKLQTQNEEILRGVHNAAVQ